MKLFDVKLKDEPQEDNGELAGQMLEITFYDTEKPIRYSVNLFLAYDSAPRELAKRLKTLAETIESGP